MSLPYCGICGYNHKKEDTSACEQGQQDGLNQGQSIRLTRRATKMATNKHKEEGPETVSESSLAMSQMMVEEKERATMAAIEALEAQMRLDDLDDHLHYLQIEWKKKEVTWPVIYGYMFHISLRMKYFPCFLWLLFLFLCHINSISVISWW